MRVITREALISVAIFMLVGAYFWAAQIQSPNLSSPDDPAYHIAHSLVYSNGGLGSWQYPVYSTLSSKPADSYYGYHYFLSFFLKGFNGENHEALVAGTKLFHAFLIGLFFAIFYLILKSVLSREARETTGRQIFLIALAGTVVLLLAYPNFTYRLLLYRPHLVEMSLVLLSFYFVYRRSFAGVFVVNFLSPFFYSLAFFTAIPALVYGMAHYFYDQFEVFPRVSVLRVLRASISIRTMGHFSLFVCSVFGLGAGVILRPDSFNYLYNAFYVASSVLFNFFFVGVDRVAELQSSFGNNIQEYLLLTVMVVVAFTLWGRIMKRNPTPSFSRDYWYITLFAFSSFAVLLVISRASEYAWPLIVIFLTLAYSEFLEVFRKYYRGDYEYHIKNSPILSELNALVRYVMSYAIEKRLLLARLAVFIGLVYGFGMFYSLGSLVIKQSPLDYYQGAAIYLTEHSNPGDIVFIRFFHEYPQLVFFNSKNRYIAGMAESYTYAYDPELYWQWRYVATGGTLCDVRADICSRLTTQDAYEIVHDVFKARYVFFDASRDDKKIERANEHFLSLLEHDSRFVKVYTDPKYPEISIYEVL